MKRNLDPQKFAAWIWCYNDELTLQRLLSIAEQRADELDLAANGEPYPRVRGDLVSGFNERSHRDWIGSVVDQEDSELTAGLKEGPIFSIQRRMTSSSGIQPAAFSRHAIRHQSRGHFVAMEALAIHRR